MATVKWGASPTSRGTVLTTELDTLLTGALSAVGTAIDNTANLDRWGWLEFAGGGSITPAAGAYLALYLVHSPGGTNYDDAASATNPGMHQLACTLSMNTGASTKRVINSVPFPLPPGKFKFVLKNGASVSLSGSGNTVTLYTSNEAVV
jgi:hypothetical protein